MSKVGKHKLQETFRITRYIMWILLKKQVRIDDNKLKILLGFLTPQEFQEVSFSRKFLEGIGVVRKDGTINYSVIMEILKEAIRDEYLKQLIIRFVVDDSRENFEKVIGLFPVRVALHWNEGFKEFLKHRKKGKKITDGERLEITRTYS